MDNSDNNEQIQQEQHQEQEKLQLENFTLISPNNKNKVCYTLNFYYTD